MDPATARKARAHLKRVDPVLARVIDAVGAYRPADRTAGTHFEALIRAIVFQQLSGKAAATIHGRFLSLFPARRPTAAMLLGMPDDTLRGKPPAIDGGRDTLDRDALRREALQLALGGFAGLLGERGAAR